MSEVKTKAVQAEAKQEAKTVAKTQETISNLAAVNADIASQSGAAYVFYKKAAEYKA